ncbi:MAG: (Fe-S)-binding protein [Chloroflexi bacterium]|nr:(Fe-S)-binding protein [Chloroflexota bacterium]
MKDTKKIIAETRALACLDCGKCTAVCALSRHGSGFSPRMLVYDAVHDIASGILRDHRLWACLTCASCESVCTSGVKYSELIKALRGEAHDLGITGQCTHGGALQALMHIMSADDLNQSRLDWVSKQLEIATKSETLFFVGCAPYFDVFFADLEVATLRAPKGSIALLNHLGIVPALLPNERCCGHDLLTSGDTEGFRKLAKINVEQIRQTGAKRVVISCAEGYHTLKSEYPRYVGPTGFEVVHITEVLARALAEGKLKFTNTVNRKVVYHDPCRLGRLSGVYDAPRAILKAIPGLEVTEMRFNRSMALCCGTQSWMNCGAVNKQIQIELLREARATGADLLLTACPKCQIHLKCAMHDEKVGQDIQMEIEDVTRFVASAVWPGRRFIA